MAEKSGGRSDAGFAFWKAGDTSFALTHLAQGVESLDNLQAPTISEPLLTVQVRAGHTLMWISASAEGKVEKQFAEPPAGCCSSFDQLPDPKPNPPALDFIVSHLLRFEETCRIDAGLFEKYRNRLRTSRYGMVRLIPSDIGIARCLRSGQIGELMAVALDQAEALATSQRFYRDLNNPPATPLPDDFKPILSDSHVELVLTFLVFGALVLASRGASKDIPAAEWKGDAAHRGLLTTFEPFLDACTSIFVEEDVDPWTALANAKTWHAQDLAAIKAVEGPELDPTRQIQAHGILVHHLGSLPNRELIGEAVAALVCLNWSRAAQVRALLRTPQLTVPPLLDAIALPLAGWAKVKAILTAALDTVPLPADSPARQSIGRLKD